MPNLFALCGDKHDLLVKLVPMTNDIQEQVHGMFLQQEEEFRADCTEIEFHANWKPDDRREIMTVAIPPSGAGFGQMSSTLGTSMGRPTVGDIEDDNVRALGTAVSGHGGERFLLQVFEGSQILSRNRAFLLRGGTYNRLDESAFRVGNKLTCIVEDGKVKFKSLYQLARIIDTSDIYHEATNAELDVFASNGLFRVADVEVFKEAASSRARGHIHTVLTDRALDGCTAEGIKQAAGETGLDIEVRGDRIIMPPGTKEITDLAQFLNSGRYNSPVSDQTHIANSHRAIARRYG